ncbi:MAG: metallophosphoesterase [Defluviitaleaceae bacterium]|nr:metallophosphoesterase [Defluviitaleaceae bacterium]MCL2274181.1 metallophosphoesterase [Defluviitaleaceae bacterium]
MKQRIKKLCLFLFAIIAAIHLIHAATLDRRIQYVEISFASSNIPAEMDGYVIAFIADTHGLSCDVLHGIVEELNSKNIDLLLLGGDLDSRRNDPQRTLEILAQTRTRDGIFGVEGNHDIRADLFDAKRENGIVPLQNEGLHIRDGFFLAGVEDAWRRPCVVSAVEGAYESDFVLLLSHNPDISMKQDMARVCLVLSGHTHGGQITFFGVWAPYFTFRSSITDYGQRFRSGWAAGHDGTPVFVSNGTGQYLPRVFARPQVILLELAAS